MSNWQSFHTLGASYELQMAQIRTRQPHHVIHTLKGDGSCTFKGCDFVSPIVKLAQKATTQPKFKKAGKE